MGFYVNPRNCSKETFLANRGVEVPADTTLKWSDLPKDCLPVVLVNNGLFTAAAIAYDEQRLNTLTDPNDPRPRTVFIVEITDLIEVAGMGFITYAEKFGLIPKTAPTPPAKAEMIN